MKIATWNVNSLRTRLPIVTDWLKEQKPDVLLLQETKCQDVDFPGETLEDLGYNIAFYGQKSYNGVAILSLPPLEDVVRGIPGYEDPQARYIEALIDGKIRVGSLYVPNGSTVGSDKFTYKFQFLDHLHRYLDQEKNSSEAFIIGGDYNIAPDVLDVYDPEKAEGDVMFTLEERDQWKALLNLGYKDALRELHPEAPELYTWWDYRINSFKRNLGWRIDHFLVNEKTQVKAAGIDTHPRGLERPSDHTPVWIEIQP